MAQLTLLDISIRNGNDMLTGLIEENLTYAPELNYFPVRPIKGLFYNTLVRTSFPNVGFRAANDGSTPGKSTYAKRMIEAYIFGGVIQFDKAVGMGDERGLAQVETDEASGVVKNAVLKLGSQIWYGTGKDTLGFPGIKDQLPLTGVGSAQVYDAGGNTSNLQSSVYYVKFGNQDVTLCMGMGGQMQLSPFTDQQIAGVTANTWLPGRVSDMTSWIGMQIGNLNCIGRVANVTVAVPLTDSILSFCEEKFPVGYTPDACFMSRRSRGQLQRARTVTLFGNGKNGSVGSEQGLIAPLPTMTVGGIPIYVTDSILNTDAHE